ncbi:hypothetical protein ACFXGA_33035 [Actinosynnema sp. NPDC059335]|uniref:hypothetical protein n=1 Tax=Actinosynnema sp. NPDC059335 TaxID=3346804 RepID=UPI00366CB2C0
MIAARLADVDLVLDALEVLAAGGNPDAGGRALPTGLGRAPDLRRVGAYGHGLGGTIAAEAMHEDRRIDASRRTVDTDTAGSIVPTGAASRPRWCRSSTATCAERRGPAPAATASPDRR